MKIQIESIVLADAETVWAVYTQPDHITQWNHASDDWTCPGAQVDLQEGGKYALRMEAKDGSAAFDLAGTYTRVVPNERLNSVLADGRIVDVIFAAIPGGTHVTQAFDADDKDTHAAQQAGWQAILDNMRDYAETQT